MDSNSKISQPLATPSEHKLLMTKKEVAELTHVITSLTSYFESFSKCFNFFVVENQRLIKVLPQINPSSNLIGEGRYSQAMINFFRNIDRSFSLFQSNLAWKSKEIRSISSLQASLINESQLKNSLETLTKHTKLTDRNRIKQKQKNETDFKLDKYDRNSLNFLAQTKNISNFQRKISQMSQRIQKPSNDFVSQQDLKIFKKQQINQWNKLSCLVNSFKTSVNSKLIKYSQFIQINFVSLIKSVHDQILLLSITLKNPVGLLFDPNELFESMTLEQVQRFFSKNTSSLESVNLNSKWITSFQEFTIKKLKSLRISYKIIIDIVNNIILSFQRLFHHFKQLPAFQICHGKLLDQNISELTYKVSTNLKNCLHILEKCIQKCLPVVNNLIIEFHYINEIIQDSLLKLSKFATKDKKEKIKLQQIKCVHWKDKIEILKQLMQETSLKCQQRKKHYEEDLNQLCKLFSSSTKLILSNLQPQPRLIKQPTVQTKIDQKTLKISKVKFNNLTTSIVSQQQKNQNQVSFYQEGISQQQLKQRSQKLGNMLSLKLDHIHTEQFLNTNTMYFISFLFKNKINLTNKTFNSFYQLYKIRSQQQNINIGQWDYQLDKYLVQQTFKTDTPLHFKRLITFDHPIGGISIPFLPKTCQSKEYQTLSIINKQRFILILDVENSGAPYTDCFKIRMRFDFKNSENGVKVQISMKTQWLKSTIMKGIIQSQTIKETKQSISKYCELVREVLRIHPYRPCEPAIKKKYNKSYKQIQKSMLQSIKIDSCRTLEMNPNECTFLSQDHYNSFEVIKNESTNSKNNNSYLYILAGTIILIQLIMLAK